MPGGSSSLSGRVAVVTGGLSGIGRAISTALLSEGASVAAGSRRASRDSPVSQDLQRLATADQAVHIGALDVTSQTSSEDFVARARAALGPIDILVNAAGMTTEHPVCGHTDEMWNAVLDVNLTGTFRMTRALLSSMIDKGFGRIVNIGSTAATVGWADNPAYCASKAGVLGLTRCVALEGAEHGVTCSMVSPTWVDTDLMRADLEDIATREGQGRSAEQLRADIVAQNPQKRIIQPNEIANIVVFLCSDAAKGLTMENIQVTGGATW